MKYLLFSLLMACDYSNQIKEETIGHIGSATCDSVGFSLFGHAKLWNCDDGKFYYLSNYALINKEIKMVWTTRQIHLYFETIK